MSAKRPERSNGAVQVGAPLLDPTGVPNLDQVLGGGIPRGSLVIVVGPPGSGKTTLANQMAFTAARNGRRSIVLTALSEPTSKLIAHLSSFRFYDDELVGDEIQFLSLQQFLTGGLEATGDEMVAAVRRSRAGFVVLDGFRGVRGADIDPQSARQFLYDIGTTLSVLGTTTVITSEADPRDPAFFPEATTGDIILGLHYNLVGVRQWRGFEAIKVRGGAPLSGVHGLALGEDGSTIYPRIESRVAAAAHGTRVGELARSDTTDDVLQARGELEGRANFDIPDLDTLLSGGLTRGTSTLVVGSLGTGKTLLGLHFAIAGAREGEPTLFLGFRESHRQLLLKAEPFAMEADLRAALAHDGALTLMRWSPVELNPDILAEQLLNALDEMKARRLVVDSAAEIERAVGDGNDPRRVDNYLAALVEALRMRGVTALFTREIPQTSAPELNFVSSPISVMAENVLLLRQVERHDRLMRTLSVVKMRFSAHDVSTVREFIVSPPAGIRLVPPTANSDRTLSGNVLSNIGERGMLDADGPHTRDNERMQRRSYRDVRDTSAHMKRADSGNTPEGTP